MMTWLSSLFGRLFGATPTVPGTIVTDIQAATVTLCNFLPMAESVTALVVASNPTAASTVAIVDPIARSICAVVSKKPAVQSSAFVAWQPVSWNVGGVPIQGRWVK